MNSKKLELKALDRYGFVPKEIPNYRTLNSITYTIYNSTTNAIVSQSTVTSFNAYEYPTVLDIYANGEQETFYASYADGRPIPGAGQYLSVWMEYI